MQGVRSVASGSKFYQLPPDKENKLHLPSGQGTKLASTVEPLLSSHPWGNGKWSLDGGWLLNRDFINQKNQQNIYQKHHLILKQKHNRRSITG